MFFGNRVKYFLLVSLLLFTITTPAMAQGMKTSDVDALLPLVGDALVSVKDHNYSQATSDLTQLQSLWANAAEDSSTPEGKAVGESLAVVEQTMKSSAVKNDEAYLAFSKLAKAIDVYVTSKQQDGSANGGHATIKKLLPFLQQSLQAVEQKEWSNATQAYAKFVSGWTQAEGPIRSANFKLYGQIETYVSLVRISLNTDPPNQDKAKTSLQELIHILDQYANGKVEQAVSATETSSLSQLMDYLRGAEQDVKQGDVAAASDKMQNFILAWPSVEGEVITRSQQAYTSVENKMTEIQSLLLSNPPRLDEAANQIASLQAELQPFTESGSYTAWDAGLILFREGLEAILIIAALLAFLNRSDNGDKRVWIWAGAGAGLVVSAVVAVVLSVFISSAAAASNREMVEGYTGLIAVAFTLSIGAWLHKKSNLQAWNQYIERTMGAVLARGALWSLAFTSFLAIAREGAETIVFYLGMAASIETSQLLLGIVGAVVLLLVIGYAILRLSAQIPIRPFFLAASLLLYYLAFKFTGVSLHALQVSNHLPAHVHGFLPASEFLGLYPSWETTIPQLLVLGFVLFKLIRPKQKTKPNLSVAK